MGKKDKSALLFGLSGLCFAVVAVMQYQDHAASYRIIGALIAAGGLFATAMLSFARSRT